MARLKARLLAGLSISWTRLEPPGPRYFFFLFLYVR